MTRGAERASPDPKKAATVFDQDITGWSTPAGIDSRRMFHSARAFEAKLTRTGSGSTTDG